MEERLREFMDEDDEVLGLDGGSGKGSVFGARDALRALAAPLDFLRALTGFAVGVLATSIPVAGRGLDVCAS